MMNNHLLQKEINLLIDCNMQLMHNIYNLVWHYEVGNGVKRKQCEKFPHAHTQNKIIPGMLVWNSSKSSYIISCDAVVSQQSSREKELIDWESFKSNPLSNIQRLIFTRQLCIRNQPSLVNLQRDGREARGKKWQNRKF